MRKINFLDDYSEGCHPDILEALVKSNMQTQTAYGGDEYSKLAKEKIQEHLADTETAIYFVTSGTQANIIVAASILRSHEAIIAVNSAHIATHETGAIEATGQKIITVEANEGKLTVEALEDGMMHNKHYPHMVKPRLVYISNATELGTIYSKKELTALSKACKANDLLLFMDGARLSVALTAKENDLDLKTISKLCDVFWLGGTKAGALLGEAIVIANPDLSEDFAFHIKQRGGLLAKGRVLGIQFFTLFKNNLFFELSRTSNQMAEKISAGIIANGFELEVDTQSNQVFAIFPIKLMEKLQKQFNFYVWQNRNDQTSVVRLVTSWTTSQADIDLFIKAITEPY